MKERRSVHTLFRFPYRLENNFMPAGEGTEIMSYSLSHVGQVRDDNQDAVKLCDPDSGISEVSGYLYGIADGMGGYAHGGVASSVALETFFETYYAANGISPLQKFRVSIQNANLSVYQTAHRVGAGRMGTTLTAVSILGSELYIGHVGDSRAYLIRDGSTRCLTNDHTRVGELVRMRVLSPDKVRSHSQRSVLNKCLGLELFVQPDIFKMPAQNGDTIILCTDGVWSVIEDEEFGALAHSASNLEDLGQRIFTTTMERNSDDNVSIVAIHLNRLANVNDTSVAIRTSALSRLFRKFAR